MLTEELKKIESLQVRKFVETALNNADPKFWEAPASSSGKYHPYEDLGKGGLIRHIKKGILVIEQCARRAVFSEYESDLAMGAFLLHDIRKNGNVWGEKTDYTHGIIGSEWLKQFKMDDPSGKQMILYAVRYHMAPWCWVVPPFENRLYTQKEMKDNLAELTRALVSPGRIELAVREGDYWSSRRSMSFLPGKSIVYDPRLHDSPKEWLNSLKDVSDKISNIETKN